MSVIIKKAVQSTRDFFNDLSRLADMDINPDRYPKVILGEKSPNGQLIFNPQYVSTSEDKVWYAIRYNGCSSDIDMIMRTDLDLNEINSALEKLQENDNIFSRYQHNYQGDDGEDKVRHLWMVREKNPPMAKTVTPPALNPR